MIVGFEKCRFSLIREESGEGAWGSMGEHGGTWESMGEHGRGREREGAWGRGSSSREGAVGREGAWESSREGGSMGEACGEHGGAWGSKEGGREAAGREGGSMGGGSRITKNRLWCGMEEGRITSRFPV